MLNNYFSFASKSYANSHVFLKKRILYLLLIGLFGGLYSTNLFSQVSGTVYKDFNNNGIEDGTDIGVPNLTVTGIDVNGNTANTTTDANGNYTLNIGGCSGEVRLCFELEAFNNANGNPADDLYESFAGTSSVTSVAFTSCTENSINLGVNVPEDYCDPEPRVVVPCYVNGDPLAGGTAAFPDAFVGFEYTREGDGANYASDPPTAGGGGFPNTLAAAFQVGAVWGVAWDNASNNIFTSAVVRRHSGTGPLGLGGIYTMNYPEGGTPTVSNYFDVGNCTNLGSLNRNDLPADRSQESNDIDGFLGIGKAGLGDLDISTDGTELWTMNLNTRELVRIQIRNAPGGNLITPTCTNVTTFGVPTPCGNETRPWATKYYRGMVYVGLVCSGENGGALQSYIYSFNPNTGGFTQVYTELLDYNKGCVTEALECEWNVWTDSFDDATFTFGSSEIANPQPILMDIEFDLDGSMILGYGDRFGMQTGTDNNWNFSTGTVLVSGNSGGDIRYVYNDNGTFVGEQNGNIVDSNGNTVRVGCNEGGTNGEEFYCGDRWEGGGGNFHSETALGGLAFNPGSGELVASVFDPTAPAFAGGVKWLDNTDGSANRGYAVYYNANDPNEGFGKATGIGDVELLCGPPPIEIGNRVFADTNANGVQEAGEAGIENVTVQLVQNGTVVATTTTNANGEYYFNQNIQPYTDYQVVIPNDNFSDALDGLAVTTANTGDDKFDSDGQAENGTVIANVTTTNSGENTHNIDFGFTAAPPAGCFISIIETNPTCGECNGMFTATAPDDVINGVNQWIFYVFDNGDFDVNNPLNSDGLIESNATLFPPETIDELCSGMYWVLVQGIAGEVAGCQEIFNNILLVNQDVNCNEGPMCTTILNSTGEEEALTFDINSYVSDPDGNLDCSTLTFSNLNPSNGGAFTIDGCTVTFTPTMDFAGTLSFTYTTSDIDGESCNGSGQITVTEAPCLLDLGFSSLQETCAGNDGVVNGMATMGVSPYMFMLSTGASQDSNSGSITFTALQAGVYTLTVMDAEGCTDSAPITISQEEPCNMGPMCNTILGSIGVNENLMFDINDYVSDPDGNLDCASILFDNISPNGAGTFSNNGCILTFTPTQGVSGTISFSYSIMDEDDETCTGVGQINIDDPCLVGYNLSINKTDPSSANGGNDGSITVTPSGGTVPYNYVLSGAANDENTSGTFTGLGAGDYKLQLQMQTIVKK